MVAVSVERREIQDDERSNLDIDNLGAAMLLALSPLGSDLSFVVYCTDRRRRIILSLWLQSSVVEAGMSP
jgi:hypothetical protein